MAKRWFWLPPQWYLKTLLVMEPVAITMFRSLPNAHPVYRFLHPFLKDVVAANAAVRCAARRSAISDAPGCHKPINRPLSLHLRLPCALTHGVLKPFPLLFMRLTIVFSAATTLPARLPPQRVVHE